MAFLALGRFVKAVDQVEWKFGRWNVLKMSGNLARNAITYDNAICHSPVRRTWNRKDNIIHPSGTKDSPS
jgi:hypothetical protein